MVVWLGRDARLELRNLAGLGALLGQLERRLDRGEGRRRGLVLGQGIEHLAGGRGIAGIEMAADQAGQRRLVVGLVLEHLAEQRRGGRRLARLERGLGLLQRLIDRRWTELGTGLARQAIDEGLDLAFALGTDEAVDRLALDEGVDRRDRLDAQLRGQFLVLVDVDLDQAHRAARGLDRLLERRGQLLARAAPGRPEVDDHRRRHRGLDDVLGEARRIAVLDQTAGRLAAVGFAGPDDGFHGRFRTLPRPSIRLPGVGGPGHTWRFSTVRASLGPALPPGSPRASPRVSPRV